jgi:alkylation response protein AidB-like acyl-CoA dehydrogenase
MDFRVPPELAELVASYRSFLDREVRPVEERFAERLQLDSFDDEMHEEGLAIRRRSAELGFYAAHMPEEVGGGGLSNLGYTLLVEAGAASGLQFASFGLGPPNPAAPNPILMDLPEHLREKYVPPLVRGETTMCFALTEPGAGSDAQAIAATAVQDGDSWVLNGTKHFITNGAQADVAVVFAVTDRELRATGGITAFLVPRGSPGFHHRAEPADARRRHEPGRADLRGLPDPVGSRDRRRGVRFRLGHAVPQCRPRLHRRDVRRGRRPPRADLHRAGSDRETFGKPIGKHQAVQWMLADSALEVHAARLMTYHLAWLVDEGEQPIRESSMVKLNNTEMVGRVADRAVQIFGGMGQLAEGPVERIYRWVACSASSRERARSSA